MRLTCLALWSFSQWCHSSWACRKPIMYIYIYIYIVYIYIPRTARLVFFEGTEWAESCAEKGSLFLQHLCSSPTTQILTESKHGRKGLRSSCLLNMAGLGILLAKGQTPNQTAIFDSANNPRDIEDRFHQSGVTMMRAAFNKWVGWRIRPN